jgi:hypothetical protein
MKNIGKRNKIIGLSLLSIILVCSYVIYTMNFIDLRKESYPKEVPDNFNFIAIFGFCDGNKLNTFNETFTKTIDWGNDTTIYFELSIEQKRNIYDRIRSLDILKYPKQFIPKSKEEIHPSPSYYVKIRFKDIEKEVYWSENVNSKEKKAQLLRDFFSYLERIVAENPNVKPLPKDNRTFL